MSFRIVFAGGALALSLGLHLLGFGLKPKPDAVLVDGGTTAAQVAMLGNSFADIAAGVTNPTVPAQRDVTPAATPAKTTSDRPPTVQTSPPAPARPPVAVPSPIRPRERLDTLSATAASPAVQTPVPDRVKPIEKQVRKPPPKPARQTKQLRQAKPPPKPAPKGSQPTASKRGQSDGQTGAKAPRSSRGNGASKQAGRAAIANYPGKVLRKLQRTRKRAAGRGKAVVGFKVSASGGVAGAWIIRSSGRAKLDAAAIRHIHRSAPFPKPPKAARRQFSFEYVSR